LPHIRQGNLTIDASNAWVILDGRDATGDCLAGLQIVDSDANILRGMQISNFSGPGIAISGDAQYNMIGGDRSVGAGPFGQGNMLTLNDVGIVQSTNSASLNTIMGNLIGTDAEGADALGNHLGIWITEGAHRNTIGPGNIIAFNSENGIAIEDPETVHNTITRNSIHDNIKEDVELSERGNTELAIPVFFDFDLKAGTLIGATCANCTIEIFSDNSNGGAIYEGQTTADDKGIFTFDKGSPFISPHLTATATDMDGNTSQFSRPTSGTVRSLVLQLENTSLKSIIQLKESRELPDNRMGINWGSITETIDWERAVANFNTHGVKRLDMGFYEKESPIDWSTGSELVIPAGMDEFIDGLAEHGIQMDLMLHFWDKEGYALGEELSTPRFRTQQQVLDFLDFVRFVVRHFKGRIPYYTIWSEPDYCGDGGIKCILPQDYIELVRQVIPVIREEDPQAKIVSAPYVLFFARNDLLTLLKSDVMPLFDVISWHPIYDVTPNHEFFRNYYYEYPSIIREIKETGSAHGFMGEYWGTDLSWTAVENCPFPGCKQIADHPWELLETDLQVAKYYARGIVMELGLDVTAGSDGFSDELRPWSFPVQRNLNTVMAGNQPIELAVEIESDATNIMSYGFGLPNGDRLFALWTNGLAVEDDPGLNATLTFPGTSAQKVVRIDVLHGFEQELITETENGSLVIRNLLVKDYPIILRLVRADNMTVGCPSPTASTLLLTNEKHGYCLLYPSEYNVMYPTESEMCLVPAGPTMACHSANAFIEVEDAAGRSASQVADALIAEALAAIPGISIERASLTIANEEAVVLDGLPGVSNSRNVVIVRADRLYTLSFIVPWDEDGNSDFEQMERIYTDVIGSFGFLSNE